MGKVPETFKDLDDAIKLLESLGRTPNALLRNYRGLTLAQQGKLEEALKDFNSALALRPDLPELWNNRGFCRFKLDDLAGAIEDYKEGLKLAQNNGAIYSPTGDTVWSFLIKMSSVYRKAARIQRASGNEEAGKLAEAQAAGLEAEAQKLLPPKAQ